MGKLGKNARKFAKKNLQSVLKKKRKLKSVFKKRSSSKGGQKAVEAQGDDGVKLSNRRNSSQVDDVADVSLDEIYSDVENYMLEDDSEGYLSEGSSMANDVGSENGNHIEDDIGAVNISEENREVHLEFVEKMRKLNKLKAEDPKFSNFLEDHENSIVSFRNENSYSDEEEMSDSNLEPNEQGTSFIKNKLLSSSTIDSLSQLVTKQQSIPVLTCLINGYRGGCHYGVEAFNGIQNSETFSKILMFMLTEADSTFRALLGISSSNCKKEAVLELKNSTKWKTLEPLIKSYLRSTLFLLNQVSESEILAFILARIRASIVFFAAFHSLQQWLFKIVVHLWATGEGTLSHLSFLIIRGVASMLGSNCFDICLIKMYKAFISHSQLVDPALYKHIQFLRDCFVELCSLDLPRSSTKARAYIELLAKILQQGLKTKKQEAVKKICSWQYINCLDLWVKFIVSNFHDYDLQENLFIVIRIINGVTLLFPGPIYLPLRIKCVQWLNQLSNSSGIFIPITSTVLDILEFRVGKESGNSEKILNFSSTIQLAKSCLKSRSFQEESVLSTIELLSAHYVQWSYHISFPELATVSIIFLRKFHERTSTESSKRVVRRFIDQVEENINFVRKKREEVSFSPNDKQSVESFLQFESRSGNKPFMQYYKSMIEKAASRSLVLNEKFSGLNEDGKEKVEQLQNGNGSIKPEKPKRVDVSVDGGRSSKMKKQRKT